jgi:hypothetical protein
MEISINHLAVIVSAVVMFAISALWYSPLLFGRKWQSLLGFTTEQLRKGNVASIYGFTFIAFIVGAYVLANFISLTNTTTVAGGLETAFWSWLGFIATTMLINYAYQRKSYALWAVDAGHQLVAFCAAGVILALWH